MSRFDASDIRSRYRGQVIAVGGPPHSGKSVFLNALHNAMIKQVGDRVFLERVCPDGEGKWSSESDPTVVKKIRKKYEFTPEFLDLKLRSVAHLGQTKPLILLDLGGKRSVENAQILARSTALMILSSDEVEVGHWRSLGESQGCQVVLELESKLVWGLDGEFDRTMRSEVRLGQVPGMGTLVNLDRECGYDCYQDAIDRLAVWLMEILSDEK
jgi:CRISPR-associated protein Csx3